MNSPWAPALVRAGLIAVLAAFTGWAVCGAVRGVPRRWRLAAWVAVLLPYMTPVLLVAYAYMRWTSYLHMRPALREAAYCVLLWLRLTPVAALAVRFAPSGVSPQAMHCHALASGRGRARRRGLSLWARGPLRGCAAGAALVSVPAFAEFEIASQLGVSTWSVHLLAQQVGGLPVGASLRLAFWPTALQLALVAVCLRLLVGRRGLRLHAEEDRDSGGGVMKTVVASCWALAAVGALVAAPLCVVLGSASGALWGELVRFPLAREASASVLFGALGAAGAWFGAGAFARAAAERGLSRRALCVAVALCAPGLAGSLLVGLWLKAAFLSSPARILYDTPVPLGLALTVALFPVALLMRLALHGLGAGERRHAAVLLGEAPDERRAARGRTIVRAMRSRGMFWVLSLLFCWGVFDLAASYLLAPSQMTPMLVLLYNQMHYGQMMTLSARLVIAFCVPALVLVVGSGARVLWGKVGGCA